MDIQTASSREQFTACFPLMQQLRPQLTLDEYLVRVLYMQDEGYRLIYTGLEEVAEALLGYRFATHLDEGRTIVINDFITTPAQRKEGLGAALLLHLKSIAAAADIYHISIKLPFDAPEAQRFCLNQGFVLDKQYLVLHLPGTD